MKSIQFLTKVYFLTNVIKEISGTEYNYYMLALQNWCESPKTLYKIHGLWPQYNATSWPENCNGVPYEEITNKTLLNEMYNYWDNCNDPVSSLWEHEYTKHLTCMIQQYPEYNEYSAFQKVIDLMEELENENLIGDYCKNGESDCYVCYNLEFERIECM